MEVAGVYSHYELRAKACERSFYMAESPSWVVTELDYGTDIVTVNMVIPMEEHEVDKVLVEEPARSSSYVDKLLARNWTGIAGRSRGLWMRHRAETPGQAIRVSLSIRRTSGFYL